MEKNNVWQEICKNWPDPVLLKNLDRYPEFPYSGKYFRNLVTGQNCDEKLKRAIFRIGKYPAIRKSVLINWLIERTV
jgi:hypothetical protein